MARSGASQIALGPEVSEDCADEGIAAAQATGAGFQRSARGHRLADVECREAEAHGGRADLEL